MEQIYQYYWQHRIARGYPLRLTDGRVLEVLWPGTLNRDAGPDFSDARLKIDGTLWAGHVEVHVRASDWHRHGHQHNRAYDQVVLHVVGQADCEVTRSDGTVIPVYQIDVPRSVFEEFEQLSRSTDCRYAGSIGAMPGVTVSGWLEALGLERLQRKASEVLEIQHRLHGDWKQTFFALLARGLGFGLNSAPMQMLALSISLNHLGRHSDNIMQLEALLFGQAGMLDSSANIFDEYYHALCREYYFLARKYTLRPMAPEVWKYARTRPQNFPHRRIAMLAAMCLGGFSLPGEVAAIGEGRPDLYRELFRHEMSDYWGRYYSFNRDEATAGRVLSETSIDLLLINVVAPYLYALGTRNCDDRRTDQAMDLLTTLKPERNRIISRWQGLGLKADNAFRSQALIQLQRGYCEAARCLDCRICHWQLRRLAQ